MQEYFREIIKKEAEAVVNIPIDGSLTKALELIFKRVHEKNGKLVISGMGKAGQIALNIATTFSSTGTPALFLHPSDAQHGDLGILRENDALMLISNSGKTREIVELVELSNRLYKGIPIIVITGNTTSELAEQADVCIGTGNPEEVCPLGLTPTTSTTVMTVIGDLLVASMMKKINFSSKEYSKRHHGGYLGDKSRKQNRKS